MAFHESHIGTELHTVASSPETAQSTVFLGSLSCLSVCIVDVSPHLHSCLCKLLLLLIVTEMFENHNGILINRPDIVIVSLEDRHTTCIII